MVILWNLCPFFYQWTSFCFQHVCQWWSSAGFPFFRGWQFTARNLGISLVMGVPNSWMVYSGKTIYKWMKTGGSPICLWLRFFMTRHETGRSVGIVVQQELYDIYARKKWVSFKMLTQFGFSLFWWFDSLLNWFSHKCSFVKHHIIWWPLMVTLW